MSFQAYIDNIKSKTDKTPAEFKKKRQKKTNLQLTENAMAIYATFKGKMA